MRNMKMTVADLEAANDYFQMMSSIADKTCLKDLSSQSCRIAATCIGIVYEMVKLEDCDCIIDRHNALNSIYNKAVAAFGGEVK